MVSIHNKIVANLWKQSYSFKEDVVEGSTASIRGRKYKFIKFVFSHFSKPAPVYCEMSIVPLIHCALLQLRAIGFFEFRSGAHFPHVTTAISHYYSVKISIHLTIRTLVYKKLSATAHQNREQSLIKQRKTLRCR